MIDWMAGIRLRLARADEHLLFLEARVDQSTADLADRRFVHDFDATLSHYIVRIAGDPPPPEWGVRVSEALNHLRSTLDNLVCGLLLDQRVKITRRHAFPLTFEEKDWVAETSGKGDRLAGLTVTQRRVIQDAQPYHAGPLFFFQATHPLAQLARASNQDKHVIMHPAFVSARQGGLTDEELHGSGGMPLVPDNATTGAATTVWFDSAWSSGDYTEIVRAEVLAPGPDPRMRFNGEFLVTVALGYAIGPLTMDHLQAIRDEVRRLVRELAP